MRLLLAHALVILVSIPSLGANNSESKQASAKRHSAPGTYQVGQASWYGKPFHGRQTASGEKYDMFQLTAAHKNLPLGTYVRVTNLRNGRWVVVRVNDRGPVPQSRIIDLSYGAAQVLDMRAYGVQRVRLDIVEPATISESQPESNGETEIAAMQ